MKGSIFAKSALARPLSSLLSVKARLWAKPSVRILMYHRVVDVGSTRGLMQEGMYVEPETFRKHIEYLKSSFDVVPLESCLEILRKGDPPRRDACCITFDDGWKDFLDHAFPVLQANDACATVFLPTGIIGTEEPFWTDRLGKALLEADSKERNFDLRDPGEPMIEAIAGSSGSLNERFETAIRMMKSLPPSRISDINDNLYERLGLKREESERSFLSWAEVRFMKETGVVQYGSHTKNHVILTTVDQRVAFDELVQSREKLLEENAVSGSFIPFSYPNGNHTDRIIDLVKSAGYSMAVTTVKGLNRRIDTPVDVFRLKRIGIHQDVSFSDPMFSCRINGIY